VNAAAAETPKTKVRPAEKVDLTWLNPEHFQHTETNARCMDQNLKIIFLSALNGFTILDLFLFFFVLHIY
jgi:hypothetical protein